LAHYGGHVHQLVAANKMQTVQTLAWYQSPGNSNNLSPHVLCYDSSIRNFPDPVGAAAWIKSNPGKIYIIGNEPDCGVACGCEGMNASDFADFHHTSATLIRSNDPTAFIITAGWAGGLGAGAAYTESDFIRAHRARYGTLDADAIGVHVYQYNQYNNLYPRRKVKLLIDKAATWKCKKFTRTNKIILTEFGWNGTDPNENASNCLLFMNWFIPWLKKQPKVLRWHWWEWEKGSILVSNGVTTPLGLRYAKMAV
jgi:hypothetical protein